MADEPEKNEAAPVRPAATSVPRDKPVIEGRAEEIAADAALSESGAEQSGVDVPPEDPWASLPGPATAEVMPHHEPAPESPLPPSTSAQVPHTPFWPFAAVIIVAVLIAVGGALGLHLLDRTPAHLAALEERVGTLQHRSDATQGLEAAQKDLAAHVAALEQAQRDTQTALAGLRADLAKSAAQKPAPSPDLAPLETRLGALEEKLAALDAKVDSLAATLNSEKGQVRATESRVSQSAAASADNEAMAILAASLLRKVEAGTAYEADLSALAERGVDRAKLAPLERTAASGVATPASLSQQFSGLAPALLATAPQPKENGFLDHLVKGAERLVRVEKIGDSGNDLAGRVARVQAALDAGAVETAYQEWTALPTDAKAKSEAFGAAAKARIDAIAAARGVETEALAALGKAKS
jgi:hypothetical protein